MAATITIHVGTGTDAGTMSGSVTGIDFISADNAENSAANRIANPIAACSFSYEKWISACVTAAPTNKVENFLLWNDGTDVQTSTSMFVGACAIGVTPVNTQSSTATTSWDTASSDSKFTWDSASYAAAGSTTKFAVFQLEVLSDATPGNWTQETINYSYDEA